MFWRTCTACGGGWFPVAMQGLRLWDDPRPPWAGLALRRRCPPPGSRCGAPLHDAPGLAQLPDLRFGFGNSSGGDAPVEALARCCRLTEADGEEGLPLGRSWA